jgi:hypothetical protein
LTATILPAAEVDYVQDVRPLLTERCGACHGAIKQEAGLRLDAGALMLAGGDSGPAVLPGSARASLLISRVTASDASERMPPEGDGEPLDPQQVALLTRWINAGAPVPEDEVPPAGPEEHWAYRAPVRSDVPELPGVDPPGHVIDRFLAHRQHQQGLTALPGADRGTLLRRLSFDLVGLPPTPDELRAFEADDSAEAYERVVDRLLDSPQYGERWGRHWMDVWRYSDWDGYKDALRGSQRHIWRWRDWIIESLQADKGYDQMLLEMVAGDELAPEDPDVLRATGFLARNYHHSNRNIWLDATVEHTAKAFLGLTINCARCHDHKYDPIEQHEYYGLRAVFEPHQVRVDRLAEQPDLNRDGIPRVFDSDPQAATFVFLRGDEKQPDQEHPIPPAVPRVLGGTLHVEPVSLPPLAFFPALAEQFLREELQAVTRRVQQAQEELDRLGGLEDLTAAQPSLTTSIESIDTGEATDPEGAASSRAVVPGGKVRERSDSQSPIAVAAAKLRAVKAEENSLRLRQEADRAKYLPGSGDDRERSTRAARAERTHRLRVAELAVLEKQAALAAAESSGETDEAKLRSAQESARTALTQAREEQDKARAQLDEQTTEYTAVGQVYSQVSTGRRLAFARWLVSRDNPLTARVAINHIWMRHFGEPLVENVFDFGLRTPRPLHADLLDWLAVELMDHHWRMKHVHRLVVTSQAYQRMSSGDRRLMSANDRLDPDNRGLWRANVRRLDAELVRDSLLATSGRLDLSLGGPDLDFAEGETVPRRSLYFRHAYEKQMEMLVLFDTASPNECYRRSESIIPQQALTLANSRLTRDCARTLAQSLHAQSPGDDRTFVRLSFETLLTRTPRNDELSACLTFLDRQARRPGEAPAATQPAATTGDARLGAAPGRGSPSPPDPTLRAREQLIHVLMNHNDFVTVR